MYVRLSNAVSVRRTHWLLPLPRMEKSKEKRETQTEPLFFFVFSLQPSEFSYQPSDFRPFAIRPL